MLIKELAKSQPIIIVKPNQSVDPLYSKMFKPDSLVLSLETTTESTRYCANTWAVVVDDGANTEARPLKGFLSAPTVELLARCPAKPNNLRMAAVANRLLSGRFEFDPAEGQRHSGPIDDFSVARNWFIPLDDTKGSAPNGTGTFVSGYRTYALALYAREARSGGRDFSVGVLFVAIRNGPVDRRLGGPLSHRVGMNAGSKTGSAGKIHEWV